MLLGKTLYFTDRKQWRKWLSINGSVEKEIWLVYYRKNSGKLRIPYNDAVEEALCYGWIDSTVKGIDRERFAQRFSPRRPKSCLSEMNKERIRRLIKSKKMTAVGLKAVSKLFDCVNDEFVIAPDILSALKSDSLAWKHFQSFSLGYKRVRIGFIEGRRRHGHEMFQKSLQYFVKKCSQNKKFGMVR